MKKKLEKSSGVKAPGSGLSAENKSGCNTIRRHWSIIKIDAITGITKGKVIQW